MNRDPAYCYVECVSPNIFTGYKYAFNNLLRRVKDNKQTKYRTKSYNKETGRVSQPFHSINYGRGKKAQFFLTFWRVPHIIVLALGFYKMFLYSKMWNLGATILQLEKAFESKNNQLLHQKLFSPILQKSKLFNV